MSTRYRSTLPLIAAAALLALPALAQAQQSVGRLSYTYGDARLVIQDPDNGDDFTGVRVAGAAQFQHNLFVTGAITTVGSDNVDIDTLDLGLGFRHPIAADTDFVAGAGLIWADVDTPGNGGDDDTGLSLLGGVRSLVGPQFELGGYASYAEVFGDGDITLTGEGLLHLTPQWSLAGSLGFSDDFTILTVGGRYNFGGRASSRAAL